MNFEESGDGLAWMGVPNKSVNWLCNEVVNWDWDWDWDCEEVFLSLVECEWEDNVDEVEAETCWFWRDLSLEGMTLIILLDLQASLVLSGWDLAVLELLLLEWLCLSSLLDEVVEVTIDLSLITCLKKRRKSMFSEKR